MKQIISPVLKLTIFIHIFLRLTLSKPQRRHLERFMEATLTLDGKRTLARIARVTAHSPHPSSIADFFSQSPWDTNQVADCFMRKVISWVIEGGKGKRNRKIRKKNQNRKKGVSAKQPIFITLDDSDTPKPASSKHFEPVEWFYDEKGYKHSAVFISMHIRCGNRSMPVGFELYLKRKTVRRLNRQREEKLQFKSKIDLCIQMLKKIQPFIPREHPVYILLDSWYGSKSIIRFCLKEGWHVICALRSNRSFKGKKISQHARWMRRKKFERTWVRSATSATIYWVGQKRGTLKGIKQEVCVIFSKKSLRDRRFAFFLCTDTKLSARESLSFYMKRWDVEIDYLYLKERLGLGDFRVRSYESIRRYFLLTFFSLGYLLWRKETEGMAAIPDVIEKHRVEQHKQLLKSFGKRVLETTSVDVAVVEFLKSA